MKSDNNLHIILFASIWKYSCNNCCFSEPSINICGATQTVESVNIHGRLSDGKYYEIDNIIGDDHLIGRKLGQHQFKDKESGATKEGTFWVKGKVGDNHLVSFGEGFSVWNAYIKSG